LPEILVEFDRAIQSIGPLREAAYRLIGLASCILDSSGDRYICRLQLNETEAARVIGERGLRERFINLVTDENLREKVSVQTTAIRNVVLALAFGALAKQGSTDPDA
jgi:His-Xaa-Ser system protein HxsD